MKRFLIIVLKLFVIAALLIGCAARRAKITATPVVVVPRECIVSVELTPDSECYVGKDGSLTLCRHITIVRAKQCEVLKVPESNQKEKQK